MTLENLLQNFPNISLASEGNNDEILEFYHRFHLKNSESLVKYHRGDDFFAFLKVRSRNFLVFLLHDDHQELNGVAVVSYRPGYISGELTTVGYLGDLRVALNRKLIRQWRRCFGEFIKHSPSMEETNYCRYYQTALMETNAASRANLLTNRIPHVHYNLLASYEMVNVVGLWNPIPVKQFHIQRAKEEDRAGLLSFLQKEAKGKPFGHDWPKELEHREKIWPGFSLENFIIIKEEGRIVGATFTYDPIEAKKISIPKIPTPLKVLKSFNKVLPFFKQCPLPLPEEPMKILYLGEFLMDDHLFPKKKFEIYRAVFRWVFLEAYKTNHMIAFCHFKRDKLTKALKGFITQKVPMGLYTVHYEENDVIKDPLSVSAEDPSPTFDMVMV